MVAVMTVIIGHTYTAIPADLGVSAFFVLSGFLITWLLLNENEETGTISFRRFYLRRTLRIFPAYYAYLLFSFTLDTYLGDTHSRQAMIPAMLYVVNYFNAFNGHPVTSVAHAWSLAVEEQFYLLWPPLFLALSLGGRKYLIRGLVFLIGLVVCWRCFLWFDLQVGTAYVYNAFDTRFDTLAIGCLLAVLLQSHTVVSRAGALARYTWLPVPVLVVLLISRLGISSNWHYGFGFTTDALLVAVLLVQLLQLSGTAAWRWLDLRAVRYLGRISYPMYLYHGWGMAVGGKVPISSPELKFGLGVIATIALATGSYYVIERPFLSLKAHLEPLVAKASSGASSAAPGMTI
jgi:peptidoglycan/LPS O-acetylase OafA/YrhL